MGKREWRDGGILARCSGLRASAAGAGPSPAVWLPAADRGMGDRCGSKEKKRKQEKQTKTDTDGEEKSLRESRMD